MESQTKTGLFIGGAAIGALIGRLAFWRIKRKKSAEELLLKSLQLSEGKWEKEGLIGTGKKSKKKELTTAV
jgi:hypothetical protein